MCIGGAALATPISPTTTPHPHSLQPVFTQLRREVTRLSEAELAALVRSDGIDILVELTGEGGVRGREGGEG